MTDHEIVYYTNQDRVTLSIKREYEGPDKIARNVFTLTCGMMVLRMTERDFMDLQNIMQTYDIASPLTKRIPFLQRLRILTKGR